MPRVLGRRIRCGSVVAPAEDIAGIGRRVRYGLGNGLGYSLILVIVGTCRELLGSGTLLGYQILKPVTEGGWYYTNGMMLLAPDMEILRAIHARHRVARATASTLQGSKKP